MKKSINLLLATYLLVLTCLPAPAFQAKPTAPQASSSLKAPLAFGLDDGTPLKLRISRTISSADAKVGETVDFEVLEEVKIGAG